jgi:2-dehydropantoate 2-reductase
MLVVGAGSVGGYFGGMLAKAGRDVTFLVRPNRARQLEAGLTIVDRDGEHVIPVRTISAGMGAGAFDVVFLSVKAFQLAGAMGDFAPYVGDDTIILPILNGMKHMDVLRERFGATHVIGGVARVAASLDEAGKVLDQGIFHDLIYGEWNGGKSSRIMALDAFLTHAAFDARLSSEIEREMWEKWAQLAGLGAITCLMHADTRQIALAEGGRAFMEAMFHEVMRAISDAWRPLPDRFQSQTLDWLTNTQSALTSSMYRDMQIPGRRLESDEIIGDLLKRAGGTIGTFPLLSAVFTRLKIHENRQESA